MPLAVTPRLSGNFLPPAEELRLQAEYCRAVAPNLPLDCNSQYLSELATMLENAAELEEACTDGCTLRVR